MGHILTNWDKIDKIQFCLCNEMKETQDSYQIKWICNNIPMYIQTLREFHPFISPYPEESVHYSEWTCIKFDFDKEICIVWT